MKRFRHCNGFYCSGCVSEAEHLRPLSILFSQRDMAEIGGRAGQHDLSAVESITQVRWKLFSLPMRWFPVADVRRVTRVQTGRVRFPVHDSPSTSKGDTVRGVDRAECSERAAVAVVVVSGKSGDDPDRPDPASLLLRLHQFVAGTPYERKPLESPVGRVPIAEVRSCQSASLYEELHRWFPKGYQHLMLVMDKAPLPNSSEMVVSSLLFAAVFAVAVAVATYLDS